jgi:tetratricopeptide (TPR) repeat protein
MTGSSQIDPEAFVAAAKPLLLAKDLEGLLSHLRSNWTADQITSLLSSDNHDARKVAALSLALVGRKCCIPALAQRLRDPDPMSNQMAEHALWSIWFRCGNPPANTELAEGARCLSTRNFDCAFDHFNRAIELCPDFAEAYNQRAIAWYLLENYEHSAEDCRRAIELMPQHFGAWAGLGHCLAHLGQTAAAIECYEKARAINPHLDCIQQAICELRKQCG